MKGTRNPARPDAEIEPPLFRNLARQVRDHEGQPSLSPAGAVRNRPVDRPQLPQPLLSPVRQKRRRLATAHGEDIYAAVMSLRKRGLDVHASGRQHLVGDKLVTDEELLRLAREMRPAGDDR